MKYAMSLKPERKISQSIAGADPVTSMCGGQWGASSSASATASCDVGERSTAESCATRKTKLSKKELNFLRLRIAMVADEDGCRPIHSAVLRGNLTSVRRLGSLMRRATISLDITNHMRQTPLHLSCSLGDGAMTSLLLGLGCRPGLRDRVGRTPLHLAALSSPQRRACIDVMTMIVQHPQTHAVIDATDHQGYSALHYAVFKNNIPAVSCLANARAYMDVEDGKSGRTPLAHAVLRQNAGMAKLLLECGACPIHADFSGRSTLELAQLHPTSRKIIQLLQLRHCLPVDTSDQPSEMT